MSIEDRLRERLDAARALSIPVKVLQAADREIFLGHLLALEADDRYLRFGNPLGDSVIRGYVESVNFERDTVFGVFDDGLELLAAGHFARLPAGQASPAPEQDTAEFGLSVAGHARGRGLGTALFVRASTHARNLGVNLLFMHCLTQNRAMVRIARKAGMKISFTSGEVDAFLALEPADAASVMREVVQEQIAVFDFAFKQQLLAGRRTDVVEPA